MTADGFEFQEAIGTSGVADKLQRHIPAVNMEHDMKDV
jgi:hypothetical protein